MSAKRGNGIVIAVVAVIATAIAVAGITNASSNQSSPSAGGVNLLAVAPSTTSTIKCTVVSSSLTCPSLPVQTATTTATATTTVTVTGSSSPTTTPPTTTPTPTPSDSSTPPPGDAIINGQQITQVNTGVNAWRGDNGETCTNPTVYTSVVKASTLGEAVRCAWFKAGVNFDKDITITASRFDVPVNVNNHTVVLNYDNIDAVNTCDIAVYGGKFTLYRSTATGCSDAVRFDGDQIVESFLRCRTQASGDHNDGIQAYQAGSGGSVLRSNISVEGLNGANGAIFFADNSKGHLSVQDNYLAGGGYTMRFNEAMIYDHVTGNIIKGGSYQFGPLNTTNAVSGAFPDWSNNTIDGKTVIAHP